MLESVRNKVLAGKVLSHDEAYSLLEVADELSLLDIARQLRDQSFGDKVTYSRKVFFPLTHLCRDVCHYCTFATTPKFIEQPYMPKEEVVEQAVAAARLGCKEALFTLGEKPELRYDTAKNALKAMGFNTTLEYVADVAKAVLETSGVLPHINAGCMTLEEIDMLRPYSASMGIMLESASSRLCEKGMPHYGSPDKDPAIRLQTLENAGVRNVPFTTGILIGIGETRRERIEALLKIRDIHERYGHIQEIIIQNFRAKPNTKMSSAPEPDLADLLWTIAVAKIIFGSAMSIQVPPNLSPGVLEQIVDAGINDWGGVSPVTPDFVNPEAPWPNLDQLGKATASAGKLLLERLTIYPQYILNHSQWLDNNLVFPVLKLSDAEGLPRQDTWLTGTTDTVPASFNNTYGLGDRLKIDPDVDAVLQKSLAGHELDKQDISILFSARGVSFDRVCDVANQLRQKAVGDNITFVVNRNINYTNICYFNCKFCAFSKGKLSENLRGKPYDLSQEEIERRTKEAWSRGATEVCMQGGIHPSYTGQTYIDICHAVKRAVPEMHIHAFSPLEIWQGAATLNTSLESFLSQLKEAGLSSLPGTAAEVLHDDVRQELCADKINTAQWLEVMRTAHKLGIQSTATIMFGHVDHYEHWAAHLVAIRDLQKETGGFTEFVPLPFVAEESPIYIRESSRRGPTLRETILMHAVSRIALFGHINNIQASWVKLGLDAVKLALKAGANDLGGTLMNESITRAAGALHGEEQGVAKLSAIADSIDRPWKVRKTDYSDAADCQVQKSFDTSELQPIELTPPQMHYEKSPLYKPGESLDPCDKSLKKVPA